MDRVERRLDEMLRRHRFAVMAEYDRRAIAAQRGSIP